MLPLLPQQGIHAGVADLIPFEHTLAQDALQNKPGLFQHSAGAGVVGEGLGIDADQVVPLGVEISITG